MQWTCDDFNSDMLWYRTDVSTVTANGNTATRETFQWAGSFGGPYCIDVPGGWSTDGLQLQMYAPCHGGLNQRFDVSS